MHTIKGMAAMMGYAHVTELAHRSENLLDLVRAGTVTADVALIRLLTEAVDELDRGIEEAATGHDQALDFSYVLERLDALCITRPTRVGLSATQRPIDVMARLLVGAGPTRTESGLGSGASAPEAARGPEPAGPGHRPARSHDAGSPGGAGP